MVVFENLLAILAIFNLVTLFKGTKVGIIGYITPRTVNISKPGHDIIFQDEISAVIKESNALKDKGVDIIIALGRVTRCGYFIAKFWLFLRSNGDIFLGFFYIFWGYFYF